ncbi:MAG: deoxynucleoside kinase [Candidatus Peribacteraceae bacterium]|nr:deoxynucleoside kinase [Candidatus Peribacteraceae bacterium]
MTKIISFEGCIGAGKTALTNYFTHKLRYEKMLEEYQKNPFLSDFYRGTNVMLETEITFLMIHYSQIKEMIKQNNNIVFGDYSIEKDYVFAKLNLPEDELSIFQEAYDFVIKKIGLPDEVIYIDLSIDILKKRIYQRGRQYEMDTDPNYFIEYNNKIKHYFKEESICNVHFLNVDDLEIEPGNEKLSQINEIINKVINR